MKKIHFMLILLAGIALSGCYPQYDPVYAEDLDLVITNYNDKFNFGGVKKYYMADSVPRLEGEDLNGNVKFVKSTLSNSIIASIERNMAAYGWQRVTVKEDADVFMFPTTTQTTNVYYYYYMGYWGGMYPGWGYGWYYPGYYPPVATSYKSGSLLMQMATATDTTETGNLTVHWTGLVNGLLEGSTAEIQVRVTNTIDQAFKQSTYLKK